MNRFVLICLTLLTACALPFPTARGTAPRTPQGASPEALSSAPESTPTPTPTFEPCAYVWASHPLPEISARVDKAIKMLQPEASGSAQAFGEDCVYSDGRATFGAMETDFYITIPVDDLKDMDELGTQLIAVMKILEAFPRGVVPGGQDGYVQITFVHGEEQIIRRVQIQEYKKLPAGTTGVEVMRLLFPNP